MCRSTRSPRSCPARSESVREVTFAKRFGSGERFAAITVVRRDGGLKPRVLAAIERIRASLAATPPGHGLPAGARPGLIGPYVGTGDRQHQSARRPHRDIQRTGRHARLVKSRPVGAPSPAAAIPEVASVEVVEVLLKHSTARLMTSRYGSQQSMPWKLCSSTRGLYAALHRGGCRYCRSRRAGREAGEPCVRSKAGQLAKFGSAPLFAKTTPECLRARS
jgi:hypothetical protein